MVVKLLGALAIAIGASLAVAAVLGFLVTPWAPIGMSLLVLALLALHKRRPIRIRNGDLEVTLHHRAPHDTAEWRYGRLRPACGCGLGLGDSLLGQYDLQAI